MWPRNGSSLVLAIPETRSIEVGGGYSINIDSMTSNTCKQDAKLREKCLQDAKPVLYRVKNVNGHGKKITKFCDNTRNVFNTVREIRQLSHILDEDKVCLVLDKLMKDIQMKIVVAHTKSVQV